MKIRGKQTTPTEIEITEEQRKWLAIGYIEVREAWDYDSRSDKMTEEVEYHTSHAYYETELRVARPTVAQINALRFLHTLSGKTRELHIQRTPA